MRIIVITLCVLIAILTAQNYYLQENLTEAFRGDTYSSKMLEKYATELYQVRTNDTPE